MSDLHHPIQSLREGHWFKLICGASFQHLPSVRSLALAYSVVGADCVDVAADPAVVAAAQAGIRVAQSHRRTQGLDQPLLMVSLNDGEDPHFRKAEFDANHCPTDCSRPCEGVCPAQAIVFSTSGADTTASGVIDSRCYGCGRCIPICPYGLVSARAYVSSPATVMGMMVEAGIDAVEIHTQMGREEEFSRLWQAIAPWVHQLRLIAVSCPDSDRQNPTAYTDYLQSIYRLMDPKPQALIWQTDGRPMSGDIGAGTTHAAIQLSQKVMQVDAQALPGFIQLAGGTNLYTVPKLQSMSLLKQQGSTGRAGTSSDRLVAGIAYGSFARSHLSQILEQLEDLTGTLEQYPELFQQAVAKAVELMSPLKQWGQSGQDVQLGRNAPATNDSLSNLQLSSDPLKNSLSALS